MADIKYLSDDKGKVFYPVTHETAVKDASGVTLAAKLAEITNRLGIGDVVITNGKDGASAYEVWLAAGNVGTEADYLESLKGNSGFQGDFTDFEVVNDDTTADASKALSAAVGKLHGEEIDGLREDVGTYTVVKNTVKLNVGTIVTGSVVNATTGVTSSATSSSRTNYVDVSAYAGKTLNYTRSKGTSASYNSGLAFYDSAYKYISGETYLAGAEDRGYYFREGLEIPVDAAYVRFSVFTEYEGDFEANVTLSESKLFTGGIGKDINELESGLKEVNGRLAEKLDVKLGRNLFDKNEVTAGKYFNRATGSTGNNANYYITNQYIPVTPGDTLFISNRSGSAVCGSAGYLIFYDERKVVVSGVAMGGKLYTVPDGAAYMRFTIYNAFFVDVQVEIGTERSTYEEYNLLGGYSINIPDSSISYSKLDSSLQSRIENTAGTSKFGHLSATGTLAVGENVQTDAVYLDKDLLLSAYISGTITTVQVGVGKTASGFTYFAHWLEIDTTNVKLYWYNNTSNVLLATYTHGLLLTGKTTVVVDSKIVNNTKTTTLKIFDDLGNTFSQSLPAWGVGRGFVVNVDSGSLDVEVMLMPRQITKKIWLFGDSYISFTSNQRWPYYFAQLGMLDYFSCNQPGLSPDSAYSALQSMLSLGYIPTYLVWALGMNGATTESQSGGEYVINSAQKTVIDNVVSLCKTNGITPVFATIPTVPDRQKTGFSKYIRSLGYRYIDFAKAVGADSSGNWNTGLLSSDGVHPTAEGARVLASRVFVDFPELSIIE